MIVGIIAEYDPFHNGHMRHLSESRRRAGARAVCVMSGPFTQRGEPSMFSKRARTEMALRCGVSAVIELPAAYACAAAPVFAMGGVSLLTSVGADYISFGAETADLDALNAAAKILAQEPPSFKEELKRGLRKGLPFPAARQEALSAQGARRDITDKPNNILAIEYLKSIILLESQLTPIVVERTGVGHDSKQTDGFYASASYLRESIQNAVVQNAEPESLYDLSPLMSWEIQRSQISLKRLGLTLDTFSPLFHYTRIREKYKLNMLKTSDYHRNLLRAARNGEPISVVSERASGKSFTKARARRAIFRMILGLPSEEETPKRVPYARVLGFRREDADLISFISKNAAIPVITNITPEAAELCARDLMAQDIYTMGRGRERSEPMVII